MNKLVSIIEETNISHAWARAFAIAMDEPKGKIIPLVIVISDFKNSEVNEDSKIRELLDNSLETSGAQSIHTVANTIFPISLWNPQKSRQTLFDRHEKCWPRIKKCPANNRGHYFHRFVAYEKDSGQPTVNQLEEIINTWNNTKFKRRSALQLSVFDPRKDHVNQPYQRFPCLHQVCFTPKGSNGEDGLIATGFYANQYLYKRAYGNYLGLCRLGKFVAHEIGLELTQMVCYSAIATLDDGLRKKDLRSLNDQLKAIIAVKD